MGEVRIPSEKECHELMAKVGLPSGLVQHSIAVKDTALMFADRLEKDGIRVDRRLLAASALLHDIMKIDAQVCHGMEGGEFLRKMGFPEVAKVVEKHCLSNLDDPNLVPKTAEEKLLMYADLRTSGGQVVSLDERFDYIRRRYKPRNPEKFQEYVAFAKQLEWEFGKVIEDG